MLALSIRQPFAELILRGMKTIEYRSRATRVVGERFWIYAAGRKSSVVSLQSSVKSADNIVVPTEPLLPWMVELAEALRLFPAELPRGVIVGSAVIDRVLSGPGGFHWHLADVQRLRRPRRPTRHPQPVWFRPF